MNESELRQAVVEGDAARAAALARAVVDERVNVLPAVEAFAQGIREVGRLWEEGEYFLPELVHGAEAMKAAVAILQPALRTLPGDHRPKGRVVLGTVQGDLHDIGKTLVATLLSAHGFEVHDLGADVPVEAFVARAKEVGADIVAASALLTTTMLRQRELVAAVEGLGVKVMVGGAPASAAWAGEIGAHFAENALSAVAVAERLVAR